MSEINQKEYLKKYLSIGVDPGTKKKKKKKKVKNIGDRVKIIDDDIDVSKTFDIPEDELFASNEDAPQIVGVIDDRPPELRIEDYRKTGLWKPVGGNNDVQIKVEPGEKSPSQYQNKNSGWVTSQASDRSEGTGFNFGAFRIKKEPVDDYNLSAQNDTHRRTVKKEPASPNHKRRKDVSPSRRKTSESNSTGSKDRDFSPPRKKQREDDASPPRRRRQDDDISPPRKRNDDDVSPPRRRLKDDDISPPRRRRQDDVNPLRRRKDDDASPPRRRQTSNHSPPRRKQRSDDINSSQRRRQDDISPPRKRKDDDVSPPRRKRTDDDFSPPRNRKQGDMSPPRKQQKNDNNRRHRNDSSSPQRRHKDKANLSPIRQRRSDSSRKRNDSDESSTSKRHSLEEGTSKHTKEASKKMTTTLDGKAAGLQSADKLVKETAEFKKRENELFANLSAEMSGANAAPIVRDRKTSKKRNLEEEAKEQLEKQKEEEKLKEKYSRWGKGLKQVEDMNQKIADEIHEMSKPLARYADDEDLERFLKEQEREGDPMLNYIRKKKKKKAVEEGKPLKPMYMGEFMPNRFGIPPGHRWDGVDRSNGYEKKWFEIQNAKKAQQEEVYKWSTEDM